MKKTICLIAAGFACLAATAQYESVRFPQKAAEIQKMKNASVEQITIFSEVNSTQTPFGIRFYDNEGHITRNVDLSNHSWYWYDANGQVQRCIDSAYDGRRFFPTECTFSYAPDGSLRNCRIGNREVSFEYSADNRELSEVSNEVTERYYRYDESGRLLEERSADAEKPYRRKLTYNKYGDLASELVVSLEGNEKDSIITVYSFDSKAQLIRKQTNSFLTLTSEDPTTPDEVTKKIEIWAYSYSMNGTLATEARTSPTHPAENYRLEWQYDKITQLPLKEIRYDSKNVLERTLVFSYDFR
jgi:YD repeat-containing protein